jgi:solute carrier family 35 protein E1
VKSSTSLALATAAGGAAAEKKPSGSGLAETLQVGSYFGLWYLFNIAYNIYNKQALNALDYPWTIATIQMATGILYFLPLWLLGIRKAPKLNFEELKTLFPIALCHTGVHVGAVIALGAGAVSFAHIVKASEPVVTCAFNALLLGETFNLQVYLTLLPIIGGVAIASLKELSFTWLALASAMLSNISSAARGVLSKKTMSGKSLGENLDAQNLYAVLTALSTVILIPAMFAMEGTGFFKAFKNVVSAGKHTNKSLGAIIALSGASYYAYNEVAFLALGKVSEGTSGNRAVAVGVDLHAGLCLLLFIGEPGYSRCRKHDQARCHHCCLRDCLQDTDEHRIYYWIKHCHLWYPSVLVGHEQCQGQKQEINNHFSASVICREWISKDFVYSGVIHFIKEYKHSRHQMTNHKHSIGSLKDSSPIFLNGTKKLL